MCAGVGEGWGTTGHSCSPPLGPSDPFRAPSGRVGVAALSPHPPPPSAYTAFSPPAAPHCGCPRSLTFSMTPTTLQPLSCSRAELSVRMGRSLRLLKPCGGGRQTTQPQGPAPLRHCLLTRPSSSCQDRGRHKGQNPGTSSAPPPTSQGAEKPALTGRGPHLPRVVTPSSTLGPQAALLQDPGGSQASETLCRKEAPSIGGRRPQGGGESLGPCGSQGTRLEDQGMRPRHLRWGKAAE